MSSLKPRDRDHREPSEQQNLTPPADSPEAAASTETPEATRGGILVNHSIHRGTFPIAGLNVAQARRVLTPFINVNPDSVAVIAGEIIEDESERVLTEEDSMLSFVKRASVKGVR